MKSRRAVLSAETADKVDFLSDPASYPGQPAGVEVIRTHHSWVFLTARHAYKMKDPAGPAPRDLRTLAARRRNCLEEVRLNRRLAPDVYLGVVSLVRKADRTLSLEPDGEPVEWLVKMRRLPRDRLLDQELLAGRVEADRVRGFAAILARFYARAERIEADAAAWLRRAARDVLSDRESLSDPRFQLPADLVLEVSERLSGFLEVHGELLTNRVMAHRIVEGHGDLRPEHVCLTDPPVFIDCLEFSLDLRTIDPIDELAYLGMECELLGAAFVGLVVLDTYAEMTGDRVESRLVDCYKARRAMLRAKHCAWHLLDHEAGEHGKWIGRAKDYLELAEAQSRSL